MLSAFAQLQASAEAGKYTVAFATERIPIYSERSGKRDLAQLRAALATAQPGHRLLIIAPYADALRELCATDERFIWLAPVSFAEPPPDTRLIASDAALENFAFPVTGRSFIDIGASTGGFTDCLLACDAAKLSHADKAACRYNCEDVRGPSAGAAAIPGKSSVRALILKWAWCFLSSLLSASSP